jgi:hypothetical protein
MAQSQEFVIKKMDLTTEGMLLHYDLLDTTKARTYTINVYSSHDKYLNPLKHVSGDVGLEVRPGLNKKILWNVRAELGDNFKGSAELEVRGHVYIPFIRFDDFKEGQVIHRGRPTTITWTGGTRQNILNFVIYQGENRVDVIPNVANSGNYELTLPTSIKPGKGYYFLVSDSKNKDQVMKTATFEVRRKVPLGLKIIPAVLVGGAAILLLPKSETSKELGAPPAVPSGTN